jgi:large subunit ribosomal protein L25
MSELTIEVSPRDPQGKNSNRRSRAVGQIPAVVYGGDRPSVPIAVDRPTILSLLRTEAGENSIFLLKLEGGQKSRHAMIKEMQVNPRTREIQHIDFQRVNMDEKLRVQVPIELVGTAVGVKRDGGVLDFVTREVEVECLPGDIPEHLALDVTALEIGHHAEAGALTIPKGVELIESTDRVIVAISAPRLVEEEESEEDEGLLEAAKAEPKVIGHEDDED